MKNQIIDIVSTGALKSKKDKRTIKIQADMASIYTQGGSDYLPKEIEHQHKVGICTAISVVQLRQKQTGKKYSPDFQYLLQKKFYDKNWTEGSSPLNSMKVAKKYGFLPANEFTYVNESDRFLSHSQYIEKLKSISEEEVQRLIKLCVDKIAGYAQVDVNDPQTLAKAIDESEGGIICRYGCGSTWWLPSWREKDISPLRKPIPYTSGHQIIMNKYNYIRCNQQTLTNTWGTTWCRGGSADIIWSMYVPTEAWTFLKINPMYQFTKTIKLGDKNSEVKELQKRLGVIQTGFFGTLTLRAVKKYQLSRGLVNDGVVGPLTISELNK